MLGALCNLVILPYMDVCRNRFNDVFTQLPIVAGRLPVSGQRTYIGDKQYSSVPGDRRPADPPQV